VISNIGTITSAISRLLSADGLWQLKVVIPARTVSSNSLIIYRTTVAGLFLSTGDGVNGIQIGRVQTVHNDGDWPDYIHTTSSATSAANELLDLYSGTVDRASFRGGRCMLNLLDKMKPFTERTVGTSDIPAVFSTSGMSPSDIGWTLCTCYGGLSTVQSDSNPDVDWASFNDWASVFSSDPVGIHAQIEGMKVTEALKRAAGYD